MEKTLRIALAQLNLTVGDIAGNIEKHIAAANHARDELKADVIVFPELSLTGYSPGDLLFRSDFIKASEQALETLKDTIKGIYCLIGHPQRAHGTLQNACSLIHDGFIVANYAKQRLPNYGVFDEMRYFSPDHCACVVSIKDIQIGLVICEDLWYEDPTQHAAAHGANLILSPNASPFELDKHERRFAILSHLAQQNKVPIVYVNHVGGQDDIVFDGGSMAVDQSGKLIKCAGFFNESIQTIDVKLTEKGLVIEKASYHPLPELNDDENAYQALVLGLKDYVQKNNFKSVTLGLSGGIDSALTLAIAVDALGADRVHAVIMPSRYTAPISLEDADQLVKNLGISSQTISIEPAYEAFTTMLAPTFANRKPDLTEENLQARIRAVILMGLSNKLGHLVLTTGNRSEIAVGYCTLYGDMAGGFAVIKDVPKTMVYRLANYRNQIAPVIPQRIIDRAPTAELSLNQKDEDSLPPYAMLDQILFHYLNEGLSAAQITELGFEKAIVMKIIKLVKQSEYKRAQAAIGPRINNKSFGRDWRYPLTNGFSD